MTKVEILEDDEVVKEESQLSSENTVIMPQLTPAHTCNKIILNLCRRKLLQASVSCLCSEAGFSAVDELSLETLTEMMQSCKCLYIYNLYVLSKSFILCSFN